MVTIIAFKRGNLDGYSESDRRFLKTTSPHTPVTCYSDVIGQLSKKVTTGNLYETMLSGDALNLVTFFSTDPKFETRKTQLEHKYSVPIMWGKRLRKGHV